MGVTSYKTYAWLDLRDEKSPDKLMEAYSVGLAERFEAYRKISESGCSDPFWTDGVNMNLCRNHIIHLKGCIEALVEKFGMKVPDEFYLPTPPEVDQKFMVKKNPENEWQEFRIEQLGRGDDLPDPEFNDAQLSFL